MICAVHVAMSEGLRRVKLYLLKGLALVDVGVQKGEGY